jgi:ferritin-like metal-binding protein YciE
MATTKKASATKKSTPKSKNKPVKSEALLEFFEDGLKDLLWAEQHLVKALPKMAKAATSEDLKAAFEDHLEVTKNQVFRLEEIFGLLDKKATAKKCDAMAGLIKEGEELIEDTDKDTMVRDVALICGAQKIEHYEIASYGSLRTLAGVLGLDEVAALLQETLDEEKETDLQLSEIAENYVNEQASKE